MSEKISSNEDKVRLESAAIKFNTYGGDYQDTWSDEYWSTYELIRGGYKLVINI